jgi:plasmid stabilization system protein ParE
MFPRSGRHVAGYEGSALREFLAGSYRVIYEYDPERDDVRIAALLHGRRDFPRAFRSQR